MSRAVADRVAPAVVRFSRLGGRGVLVPGGLVVTAAHCVGWTTQGLMALGEDPEFYEEIITTDGRRLTVSPYAVEAVADLAVLGTVDDQVHREAAEAFGEFCAAVEPVPLELGEFELGVPLAAYLFTRDERFIRARVTQQAPAAESLVIEADELIEGGTSGGPVVTGRGRLLGVVSSSASTLIGEKGHGEIPRVHFAAPIWLVRQMVPPATAKKLDRILPPGRWRTDRKTRGRS